MILPALVACLTALGPLLRGSWDLWAQSIIHLAVVAGLTAWLVSRAIGGYLPLPSAKILAWTALLAVLSGVSTFLSPVHSVARQNWLVFLEALWIFPAMAALSKDHRAWIDEAIRVAGWLLMALAFYQHFALGDERPASALLNQNVYAGAALLFLALAAEKGDWLLAAGLALSLCWTRSVGAWLGLSAAVVLTQRGTSRWRVWTGGVVLLGCAIAIYGKLGSPEVLHRWWWWKAAVRMALDRPWFGYGPGAFAYVLPAYLRQPAGLNSLYAHQYPLEICAEYGIPFALLWFAGLFRCITLSQSHKRFGVIAVLIHSLWDYPLSIPAVFWLFAYFAASSLPDSAEGLTVPFSRKLPAAAAVLGAGLALCVRASDVWRADRLTVAARVEIERGDLAAASVILETAARLVPDEPEIPRLQGEIFVRDAAAARGGHAAGSLVEAASRLERSVRLNPYRRSTWTHLATVYRRLGSPDVAERISKEAAAYVAAP
ncbi:MAG: O-antigen ligase family protein [Elusimicrobia bacterium]|nr:O-antigen ligase family protein [Elusimicrobiota bacterium]